MVKKYLVGVDIGTTGAKAIISDCHGNIVGLGYHEYACVYPKPGWVEQDVDLVVAKSMEAASDALAKSGIDPLEVAAISFSTQRCCTMIVDDAGELIRPMISWQDNRTAVEVDEIRLKLSDEAFYEITNLPLNTTWMISKILWLRKNEPENWARAKKIVQLHDYTLKAWGAQNYIDDYSDAVFYGLWDPVAFAWSDAMLEKFDIDPDLLPEVQASGTQAGTLSASAAAATGLAEGTLLCVGAGDQNAAAIGAGLVQEGSLSVSLGTGGLVAGYLDTPYKDPDCNTMVTNHAIGGKWQVEGYQAGAASVLRWFRDEITSLERGYAESSGKEVYEILTEMASQAPAGSKGLVVLPYFASATTPRWDSAARGTILGLTFAHDRKCLVRAFMEGITLEVNDMIQSLKRSGVAVSDVHILGGPTKSELWNQIQADTYNCSVKTLKNTDAAALGAIILAGVGAGLFQDVAEGCSQIVQIDKTYEPIPENAAIYQELYEIYCRAYEGLDSSGVFTRIAAFQDTHS